VCKLKGQINYVNIYSIYKRYISGVMAPLATVPTARKELLLLVKMKEKKLLKIQSLPKVLRAQAMRSTTALISRRGMRSGANA
jgi:hypothetical protein